MLNATAHVPGGPNFVSKNLVRTACADCDTPKVNATPITVTKNMNGAKRSGSDAACVCDLFGLTCRKSIQRTSTTDLKKSPAVMITAVQSKLKKKLVPTSWRSKLAEAVLGL